MNERTKWKDWTIDSLIGEGSFGKVYRISRKEFGHTYESALKIIRIPQNSAELASIKSEGMSDESITSYYQSLIEEIVEEFALMSELRGNSNIVSYEDHEVVKLENDFGWEIFIRMELLTPLYDYIKENSLTEKEIVKIGIDICKALEVCHKFNIIHRDIKPENIFVSDQGHFKLGDFGISKQLDKATVAMSKKGTYVYMAPEVYRGEPYNSSVDTYSLGIVLYKFLNDSRTPFMPPASQPIRFRDKDKATARRMSGEQIPAPCNASDRLSSIILKACAFDPEGRFKDPSEMRRELEAVYPEETKGTVSTYEDEIEEATLPWNADSEGDEEQTLPWDHTAERSEERPLFIDNNDAERGIEKNDEEGKKKRENPTSKKWIAIIAVLLIITGISIGVFSHNESKKTTVPDVVGITAEEAQEAIESAELSYVEKIGFSEDVKRGVVISQSLKEGEVTKKGTEITIEICGGEPVVVPDVVKTNLKTAKAIAARSDLKVEVSSREYSDHVFRSNIISQVPAAGEKCEKGQTIMVVISKGVEQVEVPDVVGMTADKARSTLSEIGLGIRVDPEPSDEVPTGKIISQSKEPGTIVNHDIVIIVKLSTGSANAASDN